MTASIDARLAEILEQYLAGGAPDREALLAAHPDLAEPLAMVLRGLDFVDHAAKTLDVPDAGGDLRALGDYRLLREVGRGGMAVVYEAEQVSLGRKVALKVLPFAAVLDPKQLQRFKNEALAAAHLQHPHIVPVHAVGCERGVHYYAMQYIEGQCLAAAIRSMKGGGTGEGDGPRSPISSHGSNREPAYIKMAAALGVQAAEALDHAHQLGIVHRDVKPGNLLVDLAGTLWVTDFGLARSLNDVGLTITGEILGTIRYMSPEQALAKRAPIDHRTDVYSLGATLYELFTLEPAFPGDDPHRVIQDIAFREPTPPRRLNPSIPRDLETVILKAMSKDVAGRYATAREMAADLGRFLADRPVEAKRPGLLRRAAKWSRRHRGLVAAALTVLFVGIGALAAGALREQRNTAAALTEAKANLQFAHRAVDEFLVQLGIDGLGDEALPSVARRRLLENALRFYASYPAGRSDLDACVNESRILFALHRFDEALAALERGHAMDAGDARALALAGRILVQLQRMDEAARLIDRALEIDHNEATAHYARGRLLTSLGRPQDALDAYDRAIEIDTRLPGAHSNRSLILSDLGRIDEALEAADRALKLDAGFALTHSNRASILNRLGRAQEALTAADRALEIDGDLVPAHCARGDSLRLLGRLDESLTEFDRAIAAGATSAAAHGGRAQTLHELGRTQDALAAADRAIDIEPDLVTAHFLRGQCLHSLGRFEEALPAFDRVIALVPNYAVTHQLRGRCLEAMGLPDQALQAYERAVVLGPHLKGVHVDRGNALGSLGRMEDALAAYERAIAIDQDYAMAHNNRAGALAALGRNKEALEAYGRAIDLDPSEATFRLSRGHSLAAQGRPEQALLDFDAAIACNPSLPGAHLGRGNAIQDLGRPDEALPALDRAIQLAPDDAVAHNCRGLVLMSLGRVDDAQAAHVEALRLRPDFAEARYNLGLVRFAQGRMEDALTEYREALRLRKDFVEPRISIGVALSKLGRLDEAITEYDEVIRQRPTCFLAHYNRAINLRVRGDFGRAVAGYQEAIRLQPNHAGAHYDLGNALAGAGNAEAAIAAYQAAIRLEPDYAEAHCNLGAALSAQGKFAEALSSYRTGHGLGSRRPGWAYPSAQWVEFAERNAEAESRLYRVLSGEARPRDARERIEFAVLLHAKSRHSESAQMSAEAFADSPDLAEDITTGHRYSAAGCAALAAARGGADAAQWRGRALEWLRADLAAREKAGSAATLDQWTRDPHFACVRDRIDDLPEPEREGWQSLWAAVDTALAAQPASK